MKYWHKRGLMVDILKSNVISSPSFSCLVMFSMVHELNSNIKHASEVVG